RGRAPVGGVGERLGTLDQLLLLELGARPLPIELSEVRTAPPVERFTGLRVAPPQLVVGLAVDAPDRLPLVEDGPEPVAGGLPLRALGGDLLGLGGERLFACDLADAAGLLALARLHHGDVAVRAHRL